MENDIYWPKLEDDLNDWLSNYQSDKIEFRNSNTAMPGLPGDCFKSDGMLTDGKILISIEVEASQTHPDTNVGKYWYFYENNPFKKIVLFHIYTPYFDSYKWRKTLGEFYIEKMKKDVPIEYILLDYREAENYKKTFKEICELLSKSIEKEFRKM